MNKKFIFFGIALLSVAIVTGLLINKNTDKRTEYEKFLAQEYNKVENIIKSDKDNIKKPEHPELASLQNYFKIIDPELKRVPTERLYKAYKYTKECISDQQLKSGGKDLEWTETGSNMGGRTRAVMWDPNETSGNKVWAGGVTSGLWYNNNITDTNTSWQTVNDFWPSLSISCIVYDPNNPQIFYMGTGEPFTARIIYRESSGVGIGIWRSTDAGENWELLPSTEDFKYITDIKVNDENGASVIYAGVVSGDYHGASHQSEPSDGLYRSTDGGQTWEQVLPDIVDETEPYAPADIEIASNGRIFIGTMKNLNGDGGATILYSDEGTAGTWTIFDDYVEIIQNDPEYYIPGRIVLASAASNPNIVYAIIGAGWLNSSGFNYARGRYVLRSDDGGETWNQKSLPGGDPYWASLSWHAFIDAVNPTNPDEVFVGGLDVWKTSNGGNSWNHLSDWALMYYGGGDDYVHADQHVQLYKDGSSDIMLYGTDGGVFYTTNATSSDPIFQEKNKNFSTLQFYTCDIYPVAGQNYFVGGLQDNGTLLYMGQPLDINDMIDGGDGAYCFFDENEPQIMITSVYYNSYTIFYNWNYHNSMGNYGTGIFINPADYDSELNILYANGVTFSGDHLNKILRITGIPNSPNDQLVNLNTGLNVYFSCIKVSPYSPSGTTTLFVGSQNGKLFKVTNAQTSPQADDIGSNDFPIAYLSSVSVGGSEDTLLVTFSNYGIPSVWQTYDGGQTWQDISGNLPDMPIRWSLYHPENTKQVMLATEIGVWTTNKANDIDVVWEPDAGLPNVRVDMLQMREVDNTVLAATHGRGFFYATWNYNPSTSIDESDIEDMAVYPNPTSGIINIKSGTNISENTELTVTDINGRIIYQEKPEVWNAESIRQINLTGKAKGVYFVRVQSAENKSMQKIILR